MSFKLGLLVFVYAVSVASSGLAQTAAAVQLQQSTPDRQDGNALLRHCSPVERPLEGLVPSEFVDAFICFSYLRGIIDAEGIHQADNTQKFCLPDGVTNNQLALIVLKGLRALPERLHERNSVLVYAIFRNAFACR